MAITGKTKKNRTMSMVVILLFLLLALFTAAYIFLSFLSPPSEKVAQKEEQERKAVKIDFSRKLKTRNTDIRKINEDYLRKLDFLESSEEIMAVRAYELTADDPNFYRHKDRVRA